MKQILNFFFIVLVSIVIVFLYIVYTYGSYSLPNWQIRYWELSQDFIEIQIPTESLTRDHLYFKLINNTDYLYLYGSTNQFFIRDGIRWRTVTHRGIGANDFVFLGAGFFSTSKLIF